MTTMIVDTHCHISMIVQGKLDEKTYLLTEEEIARVQSVIDEAAQDDVKKLLTIGTNLIESTNCSILAQRFDALFASVGLYPHECTERWRDDLLDLHKLLDINKKILAIGECGLDFHYPDYNAERQKDAFKAQIELALHYNKAVVIHTRQAPVETWEIVQAYTHDLTRAVFHCFSEDLDFAREIIKNGYYLGIPCTITYPNNEKLRTIVKILGLDHIVLETDAPYLPPQHLRGQKNHPRHVATTAHFLAQLLDVSYETIAQKTTENAQKLFLMPL